MSKTIFLLVIFLSLFSTNIFSQGKNIRLIGKITPVINGGNYSALWGYSAPDGREYAVLGGYQGTYFIDITDTATMHVVDIIPGVFSEWREMKTYSHYAYIVSEGNSTGVQIVDLSGLPKSIRYVGTFLAPDHSSTHSIQQEGPYLYLNGANIPFGNGVVILDLSIDPENPVVRGRWNDMYVHDCRVLNDTIWGCNIGNQKVTAINAINKDNPTTITSWINGPSPSPHNCALAQGRNYIYVADEISNPPGRLKVWNIRDMSNILLENIWLPQTYFQKSIIHNVELYSNQLLCAYYSAGVKLLNVSDPVNPLELGWYDTYPENNETNYNGCWGVYKFPSGKIITSDRSRGLFVLRYAPPQNIKPAADLMSDKITYFGGDSVQFLDCSFNNPTGYQWTITGPENFISSTVNPKFKFTQVGYYSVKLRVANSFGADSITKTNYIKINGPLLNQFSMFGNPSQRIITNQSDTSKVIFSWNNTSRGNTGITYKFKIRKGSGPVENHYLSNNNGNDTMITFTKSRLDSIAMQFGLTGDSVVTVCKVTAYNGIDSINSVNNLLLILRSTTVGIENISSLIPENYKLENNYPNPFNPSTNIKFELPERSFVKLFIYDMLGRVIEKVLSEELKAGYYNFHFNAVNLNSGVYFYRLETGRFSATRKMLLIK